MLPTKWKSKLKGNAHAKQKPNYQKKQCQNDSTVTNQLHLEQIEPSEQCYERKRIVIFACSNVGWTGNKEV